MYLHERTAIDLRDRGRPISRSCRSLGGRLNDRDPRLQALAGVHQADYEDGLKAIGLAMLNQSSRIFPLTGGIIENMGSGYVNYAFEKGVTKACSTGCYCRINSLHRTEYCRYRDAKKLETNAACLAHVGSSGLTAAWGAECLQGHADAFNQDRNEHFRAKAYIANLTVAKPLPDRGQLHGSPGCRRGQGGLRRLSWSRWSHCTPYG